MMMLALLLAAATAAGPFTPADFLGVKTVNFTAISPSGDRVAYVVSTPDPVTDTRHQSVWIVNRAGGTPVKLFERDGLEAPVPPLWSPDDKRLAIPIQLSIHERALFVTGPNGVTRLSPEGQDVSAFEWSPDSRQMAVVAGNAGPQDEHAPKVLPGPPPGRAQFVIRDLAAGTSRTIDTGDAVPAYLAWSPDGKRIAFSANGDLYSLDLGSGAKSQLTKSDDFEGQPRWSPDGTQLAFVYAKSREPMQIAVMPAAGGAVRPVAPSFPTWIIGEEPRYFACSADGQSIFFAGIGHMTQQLYETRLGDGSTRPVTGAPGAAYGYSMSADRKSLAFVASQPTVAGDVFTSSVDAYQQRRLSDLNPQLRSFTFGTTETFRWKSSDGLDLEALLMFPPSYDATRRYPTLVLMEGTYGTFDRSFTGRASADHIWQTHFPFPQHVFASRGYVVFMPNFRGSWGYGPELQRKGRGDFTNGPYADLISGVDALVERGIADPERLGIMGSGFDSYRTAYAISQSDRFKAASVQDVEFDLVSLWGQVPGGYRGFFERQLGGTPWKAADAYTKASPLTYADKIHTPTLLFRSKDAPGGAQSDEMAAALAANKVAYQYVIYPSGNWAVSNPKFLLDVMERNVEWFGKYVK